MNETSSLSTKLVVMMAMISLLILCVGPLGYKYDILPLQPALISLIISLGIAVLSLVSSLVLWFLVKGKRLNRNKKFLIMAIVISLIPSVFVGAQLKKATTLPEIHDITTDTINPPVFFNIVALRENAPNSLAYEHQGSSDKLVALQQAAYPDLKTIYSRLSVQDAIKRSLEVLAMQGVEVVNVDLNKAVVEATATTFWYGFKDDVVIRIQATEQGSMIDLRSVSRVGRSDIGANAARIRAFIKYFNA